MSSPAVKRMASRVKKLSSARRQLLLELVVNCRDCEGRATARKHVAEKLDEIQASSSVRFGVIEILAIVQLAMAIWNFAKKMGWLEGATVESLTEKFNVD